MFEHILVPLDGSVLAECVLPHVMALGSGFASRVSLIHVLERPGGSNLLPIDVIGWHLEQAEVEGYLSGVATTLTSIGLDAEVCVREGMAPQRTIDFARSEDVDLVVLSTHGRSGLSAWNLSGTAQKIIQGVHKPILLVRAYGVAKARSGELRYRRLLVPLDGSPRGELVLPLAEKLASEHSADLLLCHVVRRPRMPHRVPLGDSDRMLCDRVTERCRHMAEDYLQDCASQVDVVCKTRVVVDDTVEAPLHDLVEAEAVDLVVLSAHGFSGASRWPFGSTAASFIAYGATPLLLMQDFDYREIEPTPAALAAMREQRASRSGMHPGAEPLRASSITN